jgi:pimeloyl-ACP methyl ester carboxylesterase
VRTHVTVSDGTSIAVRGFGGPGDQDARLADTKRVTRRTGTRDSPGRTILLLHGLMGRASTWWPHTRWLADHGRVVGVDARGHGDSPAHGPWRTERFVADLVEVIEKLELGPVTVIGHSMGGLHGWELAALRPDLVTALVVEDMAPDHRGRTPDDWTSWFAAMPPAFPSVAAVRDAFGYPRPSVGDYLAECVREGPDGYRLLTDPMEAGRIAAEWGERSFWPGVRAVRCPTLLLQAEESPIAGEQMPEMAAAIPGARHVLVAGTGHLLHDDAPERYRELVSEFLSATG